MTGGDRKGCERHTFHKTFKVLDYIFDKLMSICASSFISREKQGLP